VNRQKIAAVVLGSVLGSVLALASASAQDSGFFRLAESGTPRSVQAAIDKGADVKARNNAGTTPLMAAAMHNPDPEVVKLLLAAKADVAARDKYGSTPLMYAALNDKSTEPVSLLIKA
jgi:ankyrin repeat protein